MFKMTQSSTYTWPVTVLMPADGGKFEKSTFDVEFRRLTLDEIKELESQDETGLAQCKAIVAGWKGVVDDSGDAVPFSDGALDTLLGWAPVRAAILTAFRDSITGARAKN